MQRIQRKDFRGFIEHPGSASCVAFNEEAKVLVLEIERDGQVYYEIPGGVREEGESFEEAARRETEEESGYTVEEMTFLISLKPSVGYTDEQIHVYKGNARRISGEREFKCRFIEKSDIRRLASEGKIRDAHSLAALFYAYAL